MHTNRRLTLSYNYRTEIKTRANLLMAISIFSAAEYLCELSDWGLSNLKLQKLLYFAQMVALGAYDEELVSEDFQAWALGPVNNDLYHEVKIYGSAPVGSLPAIVDPTPSGLSRRLLDQALRSMGNKSVGELIRISHWPQGAWAKNYVRGEKHKVIPKADMAEEYHRRRKLLSASENAED